MEHLFISPNTVSKVPISMFNVSDTLQWVSVYVIFNYHTTRALDVKVSINTALREPLCGGPWKKQQVRKPPLK